MANRCIASRRENLSNAAWPSSPKTAAAKGWVSLVYESPNDLVQVYQVRTDAVPNAWHESITLDSIERLLLPELDGTRDLAALAEATKTSALQVAAALERLARAALLVA